MGPASQLLSREIRRCRPVRIVRPRWGNAPAPPLQSAAGSEVPIQKSCIPYWNICQLNRSLASNSRGGRNRHPTSGVTSECHRPQFERPEVLGALRAHSIRRVREERARSSAGEHSLHTGGVTGSIPVAPTIVFNGLAHHRAIFVYFAQHRDSTNSAKTAQFVQSVRENAAMLQAVLSNSAHRQTGVKTRPVPRSSLDGAAGVNLCQGVKSRATLTPPLKSNSALNLLRKREIARVEFRVEP